MNPFALMSQYKTAIEALLVIVIAAAIAWGVHLFLSHEQSIGYQRAVSEYTEKQLIAEQAARAREQALQKQLETAQHDAIEREKTLKAAAASADAASGSLRDTITTLRNGMPAATAATIRQTADAALTVLGQCQDQYRAVAEAADGHASDVQTLTEAWPR